MQSDWSRKVQYWPHCTLDLNIALFGKKSNNIRIPWREKNRNLLFKRKLLVNH